MAAFAGKRYWLVGGSDGLGLALARQMRAEGADLVISARDAARLSGLAAEMACASEAAMAHLVSQSGAFDTKRYGRVRLWGSMGFLVTVFVAGAWFEAFGMKHFPGWTVFSLGAVLLSVLVIGGIVGWLASMVMKTDAQMGWIANVLVGVVGSMLGFWIAGALGMAPAGGIMRFVISIVGAVLGAGVMAGGLDAANWGTLSGIVASWVVSPVLGGLVAAGFLLWIKRAITYKPDMVGAAQRTVPLLRSPKNLRATPPSAMAPRREISALTLPTSPLTMTVFWPSVAPISTLTETGTPSRNSQIVLSVPVGSGALIADWRGGRNMLKTPPPDDSLSFAVV